MSNWINFRDNWFNLDDFVHIWIENHCEGPQNHIIGYYLMAEWRHNGEEVVISDDWKRIEDLIAWLNAKLNLGWTVRNGTEIDR